jgi:surface protein
VYRVQQSGTVRIVECEDGTVYVLGIISNYGTDAYVKGVREGGTITIPTGQPVNYNGNYNATLSVYWVEYNQGFNKVAGESIVFDVDGNSIRLRDSNENRFIAVTWDDDDTFSGYGDYETVWVYDHDYVPPSVELIDVPAGLTTETWNVKGNDYQAGVLTSTCEVGFDGSDIYMKGIYSNFPNSWIKGTIANGTITFSGLQYLGETGDYHIWSTGYYDGALCDLVMDYDADAKVIKLSPGYYMVANASEDRLYYLQMFTDLTIQADAFVEHFSDPVMANWRQVDGKTYELQVAIEETDYRTNGDGTKFYKSLLTLDVVDEFGPQHVILNNGTIYSELPNGELHTCMLIDTNNNNIYVYALTKAADHYYGMDGFVYTASLSDLNFTKEEVFTSSNWGWYAYFMGPDSSGQPQLSHFSYSGYRDMLSTRSADGTWTTDYVADISPDDFHSRSRDMRPVPVWGDAPDEEVEVDGAVYTIRDGQTAWLSWIDYKSMPVDYTVPATIMSAGQTYSVTGIAPAAFFGCTEMTRLTLPSSIEYIGETAFVETTRVLGELHVDAVTPPSVVSAFCFAGIDRSSCMLYVPDGSVNLYKSTPHWSEFQYPTAPASREPYAVLSNDNTVLTFYYDELKESRGGMSVGPFSSYEDRGWSESGGTITSVVFDASFADCTTITSTRYWFNGLWSLVNITGMEYLNTSNVADMSYMFGNCSSLSSINLNHFDTSSATDMAQMFAYCRSLTSLDLSIFNTSSVTSMAGMFYGCSSLASLDLSHFDTSSVTDMGELFYDCSSLTSIDLSHFNTSSVTSMAEMFRDCSSLTSIDMSHFDTSSVTDMGHMFTGCSNLSSLDLSHFDTSSVTAMWYMFRDCSSLTSLDLSHFNTSNVTAIQEMFGRCSSLTSLDLSHFNTSKVPRMYEMFQGCSNLVSIDLSSFDTSNVTDLHEMFQGCTSLTALDLSSFDTSLVTRTDEMFGDCSSLTTISVSDLWSTVSVTQGDGMFTGCTKLVGGNGTVYDENHTDYTYARIDREGEPGYLTGVNAKLSLPSPQMAFDYATGLLQLECDTPNATILYNIGDSEPSQTYTAPLLLTDNRMVRFKAVADDFNDSEVLTFTPVPGGTMDEDGKTFRISGIVTANELVFVRNIMRQTIEHLDMTEALLQNDGLADEALADMRLLTFRSPKNVGTVGARMLKDNKRLAAVVWNAATDLTANVFEGAHNPNMLLYVNNDALGANTGVHNRIVNQLAGDIVLSDTDDASTDGNFFAPEPFTARSIRYSHVYKQTTGIDGECRGWETLSLPFDVQKVTHRLKGEVPPFGSTASTLHFWLCKLGAMRFEHTTMIEANTPYIISMPKNDVYAAQYIQADDTITFSAVDATIPATVLHTSTANAKTFVPSFMAQPAQDEIYTMNVSDPFDDHVEGSVFLPARRAVRPFEAFTTTEESGVRFITIFDDLPDTINDIQRSMFNVQHSSYDLLGRPWNGSRWLIENGKKTYRKRQK